MTRPSFDALLPLLAATATTLTERELLEPSHWSLGEDARLREDLRFRQTPWGRWMLAEDLLANDAVYRWLHAERRGTVALDDALARLGAVFGRRCVLCVDDPRFVLRRDALHLAAGELSRQPVIEAGVGDLERYRTHLPLHSLKAAAASAPAGDWGRRAQDEVIETLGWVRVSLHGRRLNDQMFIAAIEGHSMDDGRSGLVDGGYAVFELWPSGSRQNLSVLVRGAFSDPETGSYAVKKYVADARDEEGRHHRVSLVSLNPNKAHYPNIELQPTDEDDITVVAKVVQALSVDDYERRPKPRREVGRRDLGADAQAARLGRRLASFFDGAAPAGDDEEATEQRGWQTRLVCLDIAAGGMHLEIGPLDGLPPFVKKLRVVGTHWDAFVLAANARPRPTRVPVRPSAGPWRWEAVRFEEEEELGMERLALDALDQGAPTVFRLDADGVGQRTSSRTLSLGQAYRLLLPPGVEDVPGIELDAGWRIWSLDLALPPSPMIRQSLNALGLDIGETSLRLEWALAPAAVWRTNGRGEHFPVFEVGTELLVHTGGISVDDGEEAVLFLHGPSGTERLVVSSDGLVSLGLPGVGRWVCALMHSRTGVGPASLVFEVTVGATECVSAYVSAVAHSALASLEAAAPPGWPIPLRWRALAGQEDLLTTVYGEDDGTVSIDQVASVIEARSARSRIADLIVDFGELGCTELPHDGRPSLQEVREKISALWQSRSGLVQRQMGEWLRLRPVWFEPLMDLFGYGLGENPLCTNASAPCDLAAWVLTVDERVMRIIRRSPSRVLVLTTDLDAVARHHRTWIDAACAEAAVRDAILTDGLRWTTHRKGSQQIRQRVWNLEQVIDLGNIDEMLGVLAEGL
jgi:hypothetical protein